MNDAQDKILERARKRYAECMSAQSEMRKDALEDLRFARLGEQWTQTAKTMRGDRPTLTFNKTNVFLNSQINEIKQNRYKPKARPVDDKADVETAEVKSAILDHIYRFKGESAVDTAVEYAVACGMGYFRLLTEYDGRSTRQNIRIKRISNPFRVVIPFHECEESDFSDMPYGFIITRIKKDDFKRRYPKVDIQGWDAMGEGMDLWQTTEDVIIAEYFEVEVVPEEIPDEKGGTRTFEGKKVKWYKLCGSEVLDQGEWAGSYVPIIAVMGQEVDVDGKKTYISLTRYAKDPQRFFNYAKSSEAEALGLAPKSPWIAAEGQIEGHEKMWDNANTVAHSTLVYKPITLNGQPVPIPQRVNNVQIPTGFANAGAEASDDLKACIGMFDASLGAQGNEKSGKAINARIRQSSLANFHFFDNTNKALENAGRQELELIRKYWDVPRTVRLMGDDKKEEVVRVNEEYERNGKMVNYDMTQDDCDIFMDSGPAFASRREEIQQSLGELSQQLPPMHQAAIADIRVRNMDFPDAQAMADRLKNLVPPEALRKEGDNQINPAQVQQLVGQLQQAQQIIQALDKTIQKMEGERDEKAMERELKADIAVLNNQTRLEMVGMKANMEEAKIHHQQVMEAIRALQTSAAPAQSAETPPQGETPPEMGEGA